MRNALHVSIVALAALGIATQARAADPGWYSQLNLGGTEVETMHSANAGSNLTIDPRTGWTIGGAVGYRFQSPLRVAVQAEYQRSRLNGTFNEAGGGGACAVGAVCLGNDLHGHIAAPSMFGMVFYDIPLSDRMTFSIGGGAGVQRVDLMAYTYGRTGAANTRYTLIDDDDTVFAVRGSAELAYNLGSRTDLTLGYTYTHSAATNLYGRGAFVPLNFHDNMASHAIKAGVKLAF